MNLKNVVKRCGATGVTSGRKVGMALAGTLGGLMLAPSAHAAGATIDTTEIVSTISGGVTAISAIGVAVISLVVVIKLYKWVQRVL